MEIISLKAYLNTAFTFRWKELCTYCIICWLSKIFTCNVFWKQEKKRPCKLLQWRLFLTFQFWLVVYDFHVLILQIWRIWPCRCSTTWLLLLPFHQSCREFYRWAAGEEGKTSGSPQTFPKSFSYKALATAYAAYREKHVPGITL